MYQFLALLFAIFAILASFVHHPHEIGPVRKSQSPHPPSLFFGKWALSSPGNGPLRDGTFISRDLIHFAETVFVRNQSDCSSLHATDSRGRVFSLSLTDPPNLVAHVGGTLLGGAFDAAGGIYLADATRGLLYLPPASSGSQRRSIQIAAAHAPSSSFNSLASDSDLDTAEIRYCNDIAIDSDTGLVYFTDSGNIAPAVYTTRRGDTFNSFSSSFLSADATGRLLVYNPETGDTSVLVTEIPFANGVGVNPRTKHVIFASSTSYSIRFVPLPPSADDISASPISFLEAPLFFDGKLPGVPDGLTVDRDDGSVYVPVFGPLSPITKIVNIAPPFVLRILVSAPHFLRPKPRGKIRTLIVHLDQRGELIRVLHDTTRQFGLLTSVERCGKHLFCGALKGHFAARFEVS